MFDPRKSYEALLDNVDALLADVQKRVEPIKAAAAPTLDVMTSNVEATLKQSSATRAELRSELLKRAEAREHKVAMAKHIFLLSQQLAA